MPFISYKPIYGVILSQGGPHRVSVLDERDPFRFRHMISTDALQVRNLPSKYWCTVLILFPQLYSSCFKKEHNAFNIIKALMTLDKTAFGY